MSTPREGLDQKLEELRRSFDESFAAPAAREDVAYEDMLAIEVGGRPFAARVGELAGVHGYRKVVSLPGAITGLLGVVGIRGRLVAAYRLSDLLGMESREGRQRWLLVCRGDSQVGLAIESLSAYIRVAPSSLFPADGGEVLGEHVREVLFHNGVTRGVLSIPSVLAAIMRRAGFASQAKEL